MKILLSTYIFVLLFSIIGFVSIEFIIMNRQTNLARSFHEACVENLENSYFDQGVISQCLIKSNDLGYEINIKDCSYDFEEIRIPCYLVSVEYDVYMPVFGIKEESTIKGYAS